MARSAFGGRPGDFAIQAPSGTAGTLKSAASIAAGGTLWSAQTGGTQYTGLQTLAGVAITGISTDADGSVVPFLGPDTITRGWISFGGSTRALLETTDAPVTSTAYPTLTNSVGAPVLGQTAMFNRTAYDGTIVSGDNTDKGCLEVYTQIAPAAHDLALMVHGHADIHIGRAGPSNRAQLLTITGAPTGGTFTLTYAAQTTSALPWNATGAAVQTALGLLSSLAGSTVLVYSATGNAPPNGGPWTISLTIPNPAALTATASLTGGTTPGVTISQTVPDGMIYIDAPVSSFKLNGAIVGANSPFGNVITQIGGDGTGAFIWRSLANATLMNLQPGGLFQLGTTLYMSGSADVPRIYGGGTTGGLILYSASSGSGIFRFRDNGTADADRLHIDAAAPGSGTTTLLLSYHNGTAVTFQRVTLGAADSGGVGFKSLRVPN